MSEALEAQGFSVWWDRELLGGDNFADDIERELISAKAVIVSWSEAGAKSRWVRDEAAIAADSGSLISLSLDGSRPPIGFRQFHCVDLTNWQGQQNEAIFKELIKAISTRLQRSSPADETPEQKQSPLTSKTMTQNVHGWQDESVFKDTQLQDINTNKIVAVLPFTNRSPQADDAFFADGVHDELLTQISKLASIQVISRTSVMGYKNATLSIPEIATQLGAAVILEGAVQRAGQRVRINVQLIDGKSDIHIWADTYDCELTPENIFDIQSDITREIAESLHAALSPEDEKLLSANAPTNNLTAYDAYLRGKQKMRSEAAGKQDFHAAIIEFDKAIAEDPDFAEPHANKARAYLTLFWFFGWDYKWVEKAKLSVERANILAPDSIESLLAQAYYYYWGKLDLLKAESVLNKILKLAPQNTEALACKSYVIRRNGRFRESITALNNAIRLDPMLIDLPMELAETYAAIGKFKQAYEMLQHVQRLAPAANFTAIVLGDVYHLAGQANKAFDGACIEVNDEDFVYFYRRAFHAFNTGDAQKINYALSTWPEAHQATPMFPETYQLYQAIACKLTGENEKAQRLLQEIKQRIDATEIAYPGGWIGETPYYPVTLPGLLGDIQGVRDAVEQFMLNAKPDKFGALYHYHAIATAFVDCQELDGALTYLEKLTDIYGPCCYSAISIMPQYKVLESEERFQTLKRNYEKWLIANPTSV